jgi:hypothetical protein
VCDERMVVVFAHRSTTQDESYWGEGKGGSIYLLLLLLTIRQLFGEWNKKIKRVRKEGSERIMRGEGEDTLAEGGSRGSRGSGKGRWVYGSRVES